MRSPFAVRRSPASKFRGDIQGLRALAVLLVLLWHAGVPGVAGGFVGVDVFFVISGFLITGMLVARIGADGWLPLTEFYARRARRLLPAAGVVLAASLVLTVLFLPPLRWRDTAWDVVSSSLYVLNWRLAGQSTEYLAQDTAASIVQHYWSLSVEEQFYLVWPLLLLLTAWWARRGRSGHGLTLPLAVVMGLVLLASLTWSIVFTGANPQEAYFVTTTRMWELALGGLVALLAPRLARLPGGVGALAGWAGVAAIAAAAFLLNAATPFPGYAALLPTLGTAAVIVSGSIPGRIGPAAVLDTSPLRAIGALSYSLYLWHWPLLVVAEARFGSLTLPWSLVVVAFAFLPAWVTYRYVEDPIRRAQRWEWFPARALGMGALCTAVPVVTAIAFTQVVAVPASPPRSSVVVAHQEMPSVKGQRLTLSESIGAAVLAASPRNDPSGAPKDTAAALRPDPLTVRMDVPDPYSDGCHQDQQDSAPKSCRYGDAGSAFTVAIVGDSHAAQWVPALQAVADARGWRLLSYTKSSCPLVDVQLPVGPTNQVYASCADWNRNVLAELRGEERPDVVIATSSNYQVMRDGALIGGAAGHAAFVTGLRARWQALTADGIPVVVLRDTPRPGMDIAECVTANLDRLTKCAFSRQRGLAEVGAAHQEAARGMKDVHLVDLNDAICPTDTCAAVIGDVIVYRDTNHLTATYALSLAPHLDAALTAAADVFAAASGR